MARAADFIGRENAEAFAAGVAHLEACADLNELTALLSGR